MPKKVFEADVILQIPSERSGKPVPLKVGQRLNAIGCISLSEGCKVGLRVLLKNERK